MNRFYDILPHANHSSVLLKHGLVWLHGFLQRLRHRSSHDLLHGVLLDGLLRERLDNFNNLLQKRDEGLGSSADNALLPPPVIRSTVNATAISSDECLKLQRRRRRETQDALNDSWPPMRCATSVLDPLPRRCKSVTQATNLSQNGYGVLLLVVGCCFILCNSTKTHSVKIHK